MFEILYVISGFLFIVEEINKAKEETNKIRESYLIEESYLNKEIELKSTDKWEN